MSSAMTATKAAAFGGFIALVPGGEVSGLVIS